jgi:hypothetical protein
MGSMFHLFVSVVILVTMVGLGMTLDPDSLCRWKTQPMLVALRCWMPRFADRIQKSIDRLSRDALDNHLDFGRA